MPTSLPIDSSFSGSRTGALAQREFNRQKDELNEKNGKAQIGKYLNEITGGAAVDKEAVAARRPKGELGKDAFFKILMTQIQNQNPLDPMDSREMTAQMAQFSSLEQLVNMNSKMDKLTEEKSNSFFQGLNLIGMKVKANSNFIQLKEGQKSTELKFTLMQPVETMKVSILDEKGKVLREISRPNAQPGAQTIGWDGLDSFGVPSLPGEYMFQVEALTSTGQGVPIATESEGIVTGISFERGQPVLSVGDKKIRLSEVRSVEVPKAPDANAPAVPASAPGTVSATTPAVPTGPVTPAVSATAPVPTGTPAAPAPSEELTAAQLIQNHQRSLFPFEGGDQE